MLREFSTQNSFVCLPAKRIIFQNVNISMCPRETYLDIDLQMTKEYSTTLHAILKTGYLKHWATYVKPKKFSTK
jgi:hypothetical protein